MSAGFDAALGRGGTWRAAVDGAARALPAADGRDRIGIVYVDEPMSQALDSIVDELRRRTAVATWLGAVSSGIFGGEGSSLGDGGIAVMLTPWPTRHVRFFGDGAPLTADFGPVPGERPFALVHGDERLRDGLPDHALAGLAPAFVFGGLTASQRAPMRILGQPAESDLGGLVLDPAIAVVVGISQGCAPIGPEHAVTAASGAWLGGLDGRPAFEVLAGEMGEILALQPERVSGYIHIALPADTADHAPFQVRPILALDPRNGQIATVGPLRRGERLRFVKRDAEAADQSLDAMLLDLRRQLSGRPPRAGLYVASSPRTRALYEDPASELRRLHRALGPLPLIGFLSSGEIFDDRLHDWSSLLALFP